jgi:hypothetical protein
MQQRLQEWGCQVQLDSLCTAKEKLEAFDLSTITPGREPTSPQREGRLNMKVFLTCQTMYSWWPLFLCRTRSVDEWLYWWSLTLYLFLYPSIVPKPWLCPPTLGGIACPLMVSGLSHVSQFSPWVLPNVMQTGLKRHLQHLIFSLVPLPSSQGQPTWQKSQVALVGPAKIIYPTAGNPQK